MRGVERLEPGDLHEELGLLEVRLDRRCSPSSTPASTSGDTGPRLSADEYARRISKSDWMLARGVEVRAPRGLVDEQTVG